MGTRSDRWQQSGGNLEPKVPFIAAPIDALEGANLVVQPSEKAVSVDLLPGAAVTGDSLPVPLNHASNFP